VDVELSGDRVEFGLNSFGEVPADASGRALTDGEAVRLLVAEARLAESVVPLVRKILSSQEKHFV